MTGNAAQEIWRDDVAIEDIVVGMCIRSPENLGKVLALGITPATFQKPVCQEIFGAILEAEKSGRPFDEGMLSIALPERSREIIDLATSAPQFQEISYYTDELLAQHWIRTALLGNLDISRILQARKPFQALDIVKESASMVYNLISGGPTSSKGPEDTLTILHRWSRIQDQKIEDFRAGKVSGISTGLKVLDRALAGGLSLGGMYTVGARTGRGKTTLGINFAATAAKAGIGVCYFTVEMTALDMMTKFISRESALVGSKLNTGAIQDSEIDRMRDAEQAVSKYRLWIDDNWRGSLNAFKLACRKLVRLHGIKLVVLDYMGLVRIDGRDFASPTTLITEVTNHVKHTALELNIAIIALSQLNREAEKAEGSPSTHHIASSDSVGCDSDAVILIYRDEKDDTWIKISKNRWGPEVKFPVDANLAINRFKDLPLNEDGIF